MKIDQIIDSNNSNTALAMMMTRSYIYNEAFIDDGMATWNKLSSFLIEKSSRIIALRGAGTINGMGKSEIDNLIYSSLIPQIEELLKSHGLVTILFDGDNDNPINPDLGYVVGRLVDNFSNVIRRVVFVAAQRQSWYPKELQGGNMSNAYGEKYFTYVFPNNTYSGDHNSFTQSGDLVRSGKYEQWYIGASGSISNSQLEDFNSKSEGLKSKAIFFKIRNNSSLDSELNLQKQKALDSGDTDKADKIDAKISQRQNVYGIHWRNDGEPALDFSMYPNLDLQFLV